MQKLAKQYSGQGKLIFPDNQVADVTYRLNEYQEYDGDVPTLREIRGTVSPAVGHPNWHPITSLSAQPFTLVLGDGQKVKVFMADDRGSVQATGGFF